MVFGGGPMHNDNLFYTNRFPENTNLIYIAAHAEADYIDPIRKEVFYNKQLPEDYEGTLLPLPDVNELEMLKEFIEKRMTWDKSEQQKLFRQIKHVLNEIHGEHKTHHLGRYETYTKQEMDCYWSIISYLDKIHQLDEWFAFQEEQMRMIAKAWYSENELWNL